jgi:hypothetical protein
VIAVLDHRKGAICLVHGTDPNFGAAGQLVKLIDIVIADHVGSAAFPPKFVPVWAVESTARSRNPGQGQQKFHVGEDHLLVLSHD